METIDPGDQEVAIPLTEEEVADAGSVDDGVAERQAIENTTTALAPETLVNQPGEEKLQLAAEDKGHEILLVEEGPTTNESHPLPGTSTSNDDDNDHEEELDRKPAFSTIRREADFAYLEESKMEEEGPPIGFSFVDKDVVLVDPTIIKNISRSGATSSSEQESFINNNNQESVPPKTTTPKRGPEEQQFSLNSMGKQQLSAGLHPPTIPRRAVFGSASTGEGNDVADDKKKIEYDSLGLRHASAEPCLPLPDYKAQVNSRSFLRVNQDDLLVDGIPEDRQEGSFSATRQSAAAAAVLTPSSEGTCARVPEVAQHVITSSMARRISDTTTADGRSHPQEDTDIPVVSAVLIPHERLEAEHRHQSEGQNSGTTMKTATPNPMIQPPSQRTVSVIAPSQLPADYQFYVDDPTTPNVSLLVKVPAGGARAMQPFVAIVVRELNLGSHSIPHGKWRDGICDCWKLGCCHPQWCLTLWCTPCALGQVLTRLKLNACASPKQTVDAGFTAFQILFALQVVYIVAHFLFSVVGYSFMCSVLLVMMFIFIVIVTMIVRRYVRNKYQIPEKTCCCQEDGGCRGCEDFCCAFWCGPCTICHLARHTADYHRQQAGCCTEDGLSTGAPSVV